MKLIRSLALVALSLSLIAGSAFAAETKPLEIWISSFQDKVYYEAMVKLYQKKVDPDFKANVSAYGFREMPDKLAVAIKTGVNPPDIVQLDETMFGIYLNGEVPFLDLTDRFKEADLDKGIVPSRQKLFAWKGHTYGIPQSLSAMVLYYRTDLFDKYHIMPEDIATWDDFVKVGEELADKHQTMVALDPTYYGALMRQRGTDWFGKDGKPFPNEVMAIDTLKWMVDLKNKGIGMVPERATVFDPVFFSSTVSPGDVICLIGADWYGLDMLQQFTPELSGKWGVMPLPAWKDAKGVPGRRTSTFAGQGLLIYKQTKQPDASWKFIDFVMKDPDANVKRFVDGNSFPAYEPAWKDDRLHQPFAFFNNQKFGEELMSLAPEVPEVVETPGRPQAIFMFQENYFSQVINGQMTPEKVIEEIKGALSK
ncbi:extracellular solute-binding protein [bacterium]|nr:extracellular solute-binding protein [bacterium]